MPLSCGNWRRWIRPLVFLLYILLLIVVLPLCIWELQGSGVSLFWVLVLFFFLLTLNNHPYIQITLDATPPILMHAEVRSMSLNVDCLAFNVTTGWHS